ncbi:MAG: allantoinase AllB [Burkholderiales bacterium]|nr:allantoinase AllB [Phycisphaerae bacterium]
MRYDLIIRGGSVVTPAGVSAADIGIEDHRIVEIGPALSGAARVELDAHGLTVFPGVIDPHVHFNEPGRTDWEGFETGSTALAAGGGTCFFDMPLNSSPPTLDRASFDAKRAAGERSSITDFALWGGLTPQNLDHLEELADCGVIGFKAFMSGSGIDDFGRADDLTLLRGMEIAARLNLPVAVHAESEELTSRLTDEARRNGRRGVRDYLATRPIVAEVDAIRRAILFAQETGCSLHIVHISSAAGSIEVVEGKHLYRKDGSGAVDVTGETCPHYLFLSDDDVARLGSSAKCAPPLRNKEEVEALWMQVLSGGIDFIGSDHSPAPASLKASEDFFDIWGGIAGVQSTLSLLLSQTRGLSAVRIAELTSTNAARRFGIPGKGTIAVGHDADLALVDMNASYTLLREHLLDRHKLSPYVGRQLRGQVRHTLVRGQQVIRDGAPVGNFRGKFIARPRA